MSELAQKAGVPRTKVYINVKKLQEKGFVEYLPEKKYMVRAVSPERTLKPLVDKRKDEVQSMEKQLHQLVELFSQIKDKDGVERREFWTIKDKNKGARALKEELKQAQEEIVIVLNNSFFKVLRDIHEELRGANDRKVKNLIIAPLVRDQLEKLDGFKDFAEIHVTNRELLDNVVIVDKKTCIILSSARLTQANSDYYIVYIKDKGVAENIRSFIDPIWYSLPNIDSVLSIIRGGDDRLRLDKAFSAPVYYNTVLYAMGKALVDTLGEKKADEIIRKAATEALDLLEEEGVKLVQGSIEDSLKLLVDLAAVSEKIAINYSSEDPLRTLFYEVSDAVSVSYRKSKELKTEFLMTAWGILSEAVFQKHGYYTTVLQTVYDDQKQLWITRKRVYKKDALDLRPLDYLFQANNNGTAMTELDHNKPA
jgi:sugar-specific transcriptional regulator TrmB